MVSASPAPCPESTLRSTLFYTKNRPAASFFRYPKIGKNTLARLFEVVESTDKDHIAFFECCIVCAFLQTVQIHVGLIVPGAFAEGKIRDRSASRFRPIVFSDFTYASKRTPCMSLTNFSDFCVSTVRARVSLRALSACVSVFAASSAPSAGSSISGFCDFIILISPKSSSGSASASSSRQSVGSRMTREKIKSLVKGRKSGSGFQIDQPGWCCDHIFLASKLLSE